MNSITRANDERSEAGKFERLTWCLGLALLLAFLGLRIWFAVQGSIDIARFEASRRDSQQESVETHRDAPNTLNVLRFKSPDTSTWSAGRIRAYLASRSGSLPEAVLHIPRFGLDVPIFPGVNELNLNRGAARLVNTASWDERGNTAIAAHRDGYFRALQAISKGDRIVIDTLDSTIEYVVDQIRIVRPSDVSVLAPSTSALITLITCYPFHHVGPAPKRFIVRAHRIPAALQSPEHTAVRAVFNANESAQGKLDRDAA